MAHDGQDHSMTQSPILADLLAKTGASVAPVEALLATATSRVRDMVSEDGRVSGALVEAAVDDIFVWDAVESSVSVSELDNPYGVQLFPNPMHEQLTITSEKGQIQRVELISMTGQIIMSATPIGEQVELDVEGLSAGMYSARIVFDDEIVTRMVIK